MSLNIQLFIATKHSLPSIAFESMTNHSDQSLPYVHTYPDTENGEFIRSLFRENVDGGITNVYHR